MISRKDGGTLRTMPAEKLLKTLPVLQQQIDALLEFDCTAQVYTIPQYSRVRLYSTGIHQLNLYIFCI